MLVVGLGLVRLWWMSLVQVMRGVTKGNNRLLKSYIKGHNPYENKKVFICWIIILSFSSLILDSLHYFDKIYKDVRTVEYHFGSSNWSGTEIIDPGIRKWILQVSFPFQSTLVSEPWFLILFLCSISIITWTIDVNFVLKEYFHWEFWIYKILWNNLVINLSFL
jgi:hypothetical protein